MSVCRPMEISVQANCGTVFSRSADKPLLYYSSFKKIMNIPKLIGKLSNIQPKIGDLLYSGTNSIIII